MPLKIQEKMVTNYFLVWLKSSWVVVLCCNQNLFQCVTHLNKKGAYKAPFLSVLEFIDTGKLANKYDLGQ
jgi:hypothetical protein